VRIHTRLKLPLLLFVLALALSARAYDYPLSSNAIRDAYLLGTGSGRGGVGFLAQYSHQIPKFRAGAYTSVVRIETPYSQVAAHSAQKLNYSVDDAVKEFLGKPALFRIYLDICVSSGAERPIKVQVLQNDKEIVPQSVERSPYFAAQESDTSLPRIGEHIELDFKAGKIDSLPLIIEIDVSDGQHAETKFDLAALR
jgi:hypothetical protein